MGRYASLKQNIYVTADLDPIPVDVDHAAHMNAVVFGAPNQNDLPIPFSQGLTGVIGNAACNF